MLLKLSYTFSVLRELGWGAISVSILFSFSDFSSDVPRANENLEATLEEGRKANTNW